MSIEPRVGMRFKHSRVLNEDNESPATYQVTKIALGTVYYRPVYDEGLESEWLGSRASYCPFEYFPKVFLRAAGSTTEVEG